MSRYIDRKELLKAMDSWDKYGYYPSGALVREPKNDDYVPYVHYDDMVKCVKSMPTVDVVEKLIEDITDEISERIIKFLEENYEITPKKPAVQCKDCKYSEHWYKDKRRCFLWNEAGIDVFEDGFCSYGERGRDVKDIKNDITQMRVYLEGLGLHQEKRKGWEKRCQDTSMRMS